MSVGKKYRFLFIAPFTLPQGSQYMAAPPGQPQKTGIVNLEDYKHLLEDVEWEYDQGPLAPYGDWPVENRVEFCQVAPGRLKIVREACESGKYNGIILLGGGQPGYMEARDIARQYGIPVTAFGFSQMHIATMLGNKFSIIDVSESHNMYYYYLVLQHRMQDRCASIRNVHVPLPKPEYKDNIFIFEERDKAIRGEPSIVVDRAVAEAVAAIEEDGAEVITFGCAGVFWLKPFVEKALAEIGWEVPVLEGYSCSIVLAKLMVDLGVDASGLNFPGDRPKKWRRKKTF
ncbi:aspartate/glutamate racemase family protein [Chloroflexota bacterium]